MPMLKVKLNFTVEKVKYEEPNIKAVLNNTERFYDGKEEQYIKSTFDAMDTVRYLGDWEEEDIVDANWVDDSFAIEFTLKDGNARLVRRYLRTVSLEDTMYESCQDCAWILFTRDKSSHYEYATVDFRRNRIEVSSV